MDRSHFSGYDFAKFHRNSISTPIQNSFVFPKGCVTYTVGEKPVGYTRHCIINEFIQMFFLYYGNYMECHGLNKVREEGCIGDGWILVKMTQRAADFWNGNVWDQWKEKWPRCASLSD